MDLEQETAAAVERMIEVIKRCPDTVTLGEIAAAAGYSQRHCKRIFKQHTGKPIGEYVRLLALTGAAQEIAVPGAAILDVALSHRYGSHEGFTKAFTAAFGITPSVYRKGERPIQYFIPYPIRPNFKQGGNEMEPKICTATFSQKEARKLIFLASKSAQDYMSYCNEVGCDWTGLLASIPSRLDDPALVTLHDAAVPDGFSNCAGGVEVPAGYAGEIPAGYRVVDLAPCEMLTFRSQPYENEEDFCIAIEEVFAACETYDPAPHGYRFAPKLAPLCNFGATAETGARISLPVERI